MKQLVKVVSHHKHNIQNLEEYIISSQSILVENIITG